MPELTSSSSNRHYSVALVGLGRIAWRFDANRADGPALTHFGAYRRNSRTRVICGYSPVAQELLEFANATGAIACERFEEVLGRRPDIVSICSPSEFHFEQTLPCLELGTPMVWLEKPPTLKLSELDALLNHPAYCSGKSKVLVNYTRRYSKIYNRLGAIWRERLLGRPLAMQVLYSRGLELNGSHFLDFVLSMLDDQSPRELVISVTERQKPNPTFLLRFADDFVVSVCGHDAGYHINDVLLVCENGRASILSGGLETRVERNVENEHYAGFFRLKETDRELLTSGEPDDSFSAALSDLIDARETGRQPRSNLMTARLTQAVIEEVRRG